MKPAGRERAEGQGETRGTWIGREGSSAGETGGKRRGRREMGKKKWGKEGGQSKRVRRKENAERKGKEKRKNREREGKLVGTRIKKAGRRQEMRGTAEEKGKGR